MAKNRNTMLEHNYITIRKIETKQNKKGDCDGLDWTYRILL